MSFASNCDRIYDYDRVVEINGVSIKYAKDFNPYRRNIICTSSKLSQMYIKKFGSYPNKYSNDYFTKYEKLLEEVDVNKLPDLQIIAVTGYH